MAERPKEFKEDPNFTPWGPFISPNYVLEPITVADVATASAVFGLTLVNVVIAIYMGYGQTKGSKTPLRSVYVWMIWLELLVSFCMGLECFLHLLKLIRPSMSCLTWVKMIMLTDLRFCILLYNSYVSLSCASNDYIIGRLIQWQSSSGVFRCNCCYKSSSIESVSSSLTEPFRARS